MLVKYAGLWEFRDRRCTGIWRRVPRCLSFRMKLLNLSLDSNTRSHQRILNPKGLDERFEKCAVNVQSSCQLTTFPVQLTRFPSKFKGLRNSPKPLFIKAGPTAVSKNPVKYLF